VLLTQEQNKNILHALVEGIMGRLVRDAVALTALVGFVVMIAVWSAALTGHA
jgi:hypothetical protein